MWREHSFKPGNTPFSGGKGKEKSYNDLRNILFCQRRTVFLPFLPKMSPFHIQQFCLHISTSRLKIWRLKNNIYITKLHDLLIVSFFLTFVPFLFSVFVYTYFFVCLFFVFLFYCASICRRVVIHVCLLVGVCLSVTVLKTVCPCFSLFVLFLGIFMCLNVNLFIWTYSNDASFILLSLALTPGNI